MPNAMPRTFPKAPASATFPDEEPPTKPMSDYVIRTDTPDGHAYVASLSSYATRYTHDIARAMTFWDVITAEQMCLPGEETYEIVPANQRIPYRVTTPPRATRGTDANQIGEALATIRRHRQQLVEEISTYQGRVVAEQHVSSVARALVLVLAGAALK